MVDLQNVKWWEQEYSKLIDEYLRDKKNGVRYTGKPAADQTVSAYRTSLRKLERAVGKHLEDATAEELESAMLAMREDDSVGASTFSLMVTACRGFFLWALRYHPEMVKVTEPPLEGLAWKQSRRPSNPRKSLDERSFKRLIEAMEEIDEDRKETALASDPRVANAPWFIDPLRVEKKTLPLKLMFYGGLRISEATHLKTKLVEPDGVYVVGKGSKGRFVPMPAFVMEELHDFIREAEPKEYVFEAPAWSPRAAEGVPITDAGLSRAFREAREYLNWDPDITPHTLRHSFANQAKNRVKLDTLQDLLGHDSILTTRLYLTNDTDEIKAEAKKIWS